MAVAYSLNSKVSSMLQLLLLLSSSIVFQTMTAAAEERKGAATTLAEQGQEDRCGGLGRQRHLRASCKLHGLRLRILVAAPRQLLDRDAADGHHPRLS